jgi:nitrogen fixation protein FixH
MQSSFKLTGRHVLAILIAFFLTVIAANTVFIMFAVKSFPGEREKKSYLQGLAFNEHLKEREAQTALGWTAEVAGVKLNGAHAEIDLYFASSMTAPIVDLEISGLLARPADNEDDHALSFEQIAAGRYRATIDGVKPGIWRLDATARNERGDSFALEKRLTLE